mmetsp:Transcript_1904/g.3923  ORF Transcript_1904/g.3923 Transcript_1904/m.3923 type:complete len:117 (+) Transcript_1904:148-498(+)
MKTLSQSGLEEWQEIDDALFSIDTLLDIFDKARKHSFTILLSVAIVFAAVGMCSNCQGGKMADRAATNIAAFQTKQPPPLAFAGPPSPNPSAAKGGSWINNAPVQQGGPLFQGASN